MPTDRQTKERPRSPGRPSSVRAWRKSPESLVLSFDRAMAAFPQCEKRKLFGYPCAFVNGQMAAGLHQEHFFVRLGEADREELVRQGGGPFEPMPGRAMKEYVVIPGRMLESERELRRWVEEAVRYTASLPGKGKRERGKKSA